MRPKMTKRVGFGNPSTRLGAGPLTCLLAVFLTAMALGASAADQAGAKPKPMPAIYSITDPSMIDGFMPRADRVKADFNLLLATAGGSSDPAMAWKKWIKPGQRIGIKISTMPGKVMGTHAALIDAIVSSLLRAGHPASNILIFDRYAVEMQEAGWSIGPRGDGTTVTAIWPQEGYDPQMVYNCPYLGQLIWGDYEFKGQQWDKPSSDDKGAASNKSYFSKIVTQKVDVLIDLPVLTTRDGVGVYGAIATLPLGVIDNQRRFFAPFFGREENIADLATHKAIRGKWVLTIMDGLLGQYAGGPKFDPKYVWPQCTLWLSEDPVGLDALALQLINERRPGQNIKVVDPEETAYLKSCENLGFGSTNLDPPRIRELGLPVFVSE
jgi:uncharacterized protein (DUF362 family)